MKSEKEKMCTGAIYSPLDKQLSKDRLKARELLKELNDSLESEGAIRRNILKKLIPNQGKNVWIQPPFYCDYGYNITVGSKVFFNFNCIVLDAAPIKIGSRTLFGPNVQLYTALHPMNHKERSSLLESAKPIVIGEDVWIGGSVVVCPGITIGNRAVIGAGSVVTKDVPQDVFAAGNPCKIIRTLEQ